MGLESRILPAQTGVTTPQESIMNLMQLGLLVLFSLVGSYAGRYLQGMFAGEISPSAASSPAALRPEREVHGRRVRPHPRGRAQDG